MHEDAAIVLDSSIGNFKSKEFLVSEILIEADNLNQNKNAPA